MGAETKPFAYALLRVVPCAQRGEAINVGVVLFCRQHDYLDMAFGLDHTKLTAIAPDADLDAIAQRLEEIRSVVRGEIEGDALSEMEKSDRFGWIVAPSSTIIQASEVHAGLTTDPGAELDRLFKTLVL